MDDLIKDTVKTYLFEYRQVSKALALNYKMLEDEKDVLNFDQMKNSVDISTKIQRNTLDFITNELTKLVTK